MTRRRFVAANWKMNHGVEDAIKFFAIMQRQPLLVEDIDIVVCPPFTALYSAGIAVQDTEIKIGAQNCHWEDSGAFTGEISAPLLKELGCQYVIVGHSERRHAFGETDERIQAKVDKVFEHGMIPVLCVGETLAGRESGKTLDIVSAQLEKVASRIEKNQIESLVVAYEPVWAIGTGKNATPAEAQEVHKFIREWLGKKFGTYVANLVRIIYGGSVKPDNMAGIVGEPDIDGALIGGASLDANGFLEMVKLCASVKR